MVLLKKLLGSTAVLALTGGAHAATTPLFGSVGIFSVDGGNESLVSTLIIDSAVLETTPLTPGVSNDVTLTITWSDISYASVDNSGNPFPLSTRPKYLSTIETVFTGTTDATNNSILTIEDTVFTAVGCADIDPGACETGPSGGSANDFNGSSLSVSSNPGWENGVVLDFSAGMTVSSIISIGFIPTVARYEFNLIETAVVPLPAAVWFFGTGLLGLATMRRTRASTRCSVS